MKTITGTWQNPDGTPVAFGTLYLKLVQDAVVVGTGLVAPSIVSFTLDANGSLGTGVSIYGSDELSPPGVAYIVTVSEKGSGQVFGPEFYIISGTSPINLNTLSPTSNSPVVFSGAVLLNPTGLQTIVGGDLAIGGAAALRLSGTIATVKGVNTVQNGIPAEYASTNILQAANIGVTTLYTSTSVPNITLYRISGYVVVTRVASVSSTLPNLQIQWTDGQNFVAQTASFVSSAPSANTLNTLFFFTLPIQVSAGTNIQFQTGNLTAYASVGGTSMQYSVYLAVEGL